MKKKRYLYWLLAFLFCFALGCSIYKDTINTENPEQVEIIDSGTYYRIYKGSMNQVCYNIYNSKGGVVLSQKTDRPLKINMINNIVDIEIGMGTGIATHKYYSVDKNIFSQEFSYVLSNFEQLVAYINVPDERPLENRKIVVQNIFDKRLFYKEFQLDFSFVDTPVVEAEFSKDGASLLLTYLSGEKQTQTSEILDLTV